MVIRDFKVGALLVTGCDSTLYCKLSEAPAGVSGSCLLVDIARGEVINTVDIRGARPAHPSDFSRAAERFADSLIFHPENSPLKKGL